MENMQVAGLVAQVMIYDLRIVYIFTTQNGDEAIRLLALGTHDEVY